MQHLVRCLHHRHCHRSARTCPRESFYMRPPIGKAMSDANSRHPTDASSAKSSRPSSVRTAMRRARARCAGTRCGRRDQPARPAPADVQLRQPAQPDREQSGRGGAGTQATGRELSHLERGHHCAEPGAAPSRQQGRGRIEQRQGGRVKTTAADQARISGPFR